MRCEIRPELSTSILHAHSRNLFPFYEQAEQERPEIRVPPSVQDAPRQLERLALGEVDSRCTAIGGYVLPVPSEDLS
jgi:hypothetical protein